MTNRQIQLLENIYDALSYIHACTAPASDSAILRELAELIRDQRNIMLKRLTD